MTAPKLGDVIEVGEPNYRYGTGKLILRVTQIGRHVRAADDEWLDLDGLELRADGTQLGPQPRHASVRVAAVQIRRGRNERS
jgi:hypothetical protein